MRSFTICVLALAMVLGFAMADYYGNSYGSGYGGSYSGGYGYGALPLYQGFGGLTGSGSTGTGAGSGCEYYVQFFFIL